MRQGNADPTMALNGAVPHYMPTNFWMILCVALGAMFAASGATHSVFEGRVGDP